MHASIPPSSARIRPTLSPPPPPLTHLRYRRWKLAGGSDISVVARTTVHAMQRKGASGATGSGGTQGFAPKLVSVFTVNEWDPKASG